MNDQNRRRDDSHPDQPLDWQSDALHPEYRRPVTQDAIDGAKKEMIDAGMTLLALERIEAAVLPIPDTKPKLWAAIGPLESIRRLLSYEESDSAGAARQGGDTSKESCLAAPQAGAGKVEVPAEPTLEMLQAACDAAGYLGDNRWAKGYRAMLAASPAAPVATDEIPKDAPAAFARRYTMNLEKIRALEAELLAANTRSAELSVAPVAEKEPTPATGEGQQQDEPVGYINPSEPIASDAFRWPGTALSAEYSVPVYTRASLSSPAERQEAEAPMHKDVEWLTQAAEEARDSTEVATKIRQACYAAARLAAPSSPSGEIGTVDTPEFRVAFYNILGAQYFSAVSDIDQHTAQAVKAAREGGAIVGWNDALAEAAAACEAVQDQCSERDGGKWPELRDDAASGAGECLCAVRALRTPQPSIEQGEG